MKYICCLILLTSNLISSTIDKYDNIDGVFISKNGIDYRKIDYDIDKKKKFQNFTLKIAITQDKLDTKTTYLTVITDINTLKNTNAKYFIKDHMMMIKLDVNTPENLYFEFLYEKPKRIAFRFNVISEFEYKYILPLEGILYGLSYGIIFSAFIYYMGIFFSTNRVSFLFYSIMQFFVLLSLIGFVYSSFRPYTNDFEKTIIDMCETLSFIFTLLFSKDILGTKRKMPFINHLFNFLIFVNIADIIGTLIFERSLFYVDSFFFINFLLPTIAGIIAVYKGDKYAIFYTLGWLIICCSVFAYEIDIIPLSGIYTIHIVAPLESLIFSFALGLMLKKIVNEQNEQEKLLIHKSKLASMGEMINNIAHQWRQPLMHLGYINMNLEMLSQSDKYEKNFFIKKMKESNSQIKFMSSTIDDFRDFYHIEKERQEFLVSNACQLAINIITPTLKKKKITINLKIENDTKINGYENEYAQVILNFFTNSIELFEFKKIENPTIDILITTIHNKSITKVFDNAKGIDDNNLEKIFDAHFSTKKRGSGIGLYMSRVIIQSHFKGNIYASNTSKGTCFSIEL